MRNLSNRLERLETARMPPDDSRVKEGARQFMKKMQELVDRLQESDRDASCEDYEKKSVAQRVAWKVRFLGADMDNELAEYLKRRDTDPDAGLHHWRFHHYIGL
jgi:hypothetical protein